MTAILAGGEVIITARSKADRSFETSNPGPAVRDWLRGKKGHIVRIKAGLKILGDDNVDEGDSFVGYGMGGRELVPALVRTLQSSDSFARSEAAEDLGQLDTMARPAIPALRAALQDEDSFVRVFAGEALAHIDPESKLVLPIFRAALQDRDAAVRVAAIDSLARLGPHVSAILPELVASLGTDKDAMVRRVAAYALGEIAPFPAPGELQPQRIVAHLTKALQRDQDFAVRLWALRALRRFGPDASDALPAIEAILRDPEHHGYLHSDAGDILCRFGPAAIPVLCQMLHDGSCERLDVLAEYLHLLGPQARPVIPFLMAKLKTGTRLLRFYPAEALLRIDRDLVMREVAPELGRLLEDKGAQSRVLSLLSGGGPGAYEAVPGLCSLLKPEDPQQRIEVATILGQIGPEARPAIPALKRALADDFVRVRVAVALALARIAGAEEARSVLLTALCDENEHVRTSAAAALLELGTNGTFAIQALRRELERRKGAERLALALVLRRLERSGEEGERGYGKALEVLLHGLSSKDAAERMEAMRILRELGSEAKRALPALIALLQSSNATEAAQAAQSLGRIGTEAAAAIPALNKALQENSVHLRMQAGIALCRIDPNHPSAKAVSEAVAK